MKKLFKVLNNDLTSPFQSFQFEMGKKYYCNNFDDNYENDCSNGFYATDLNGLIYSFRVDKKVFECKVSGKKVEINKYKRRYEYIRLLNEISHDDLKKMLIKNKIDNQEGFQYTEALFPINPLLIKRGAKVSEKEIKLLGQWASVWDSVRASVRASVGDSVGASVWDSVWASVWDSVRASVGDSVGDSVRASVGDSVGASVWDSVWASVWAYISSLFPKIKKWKYINHKDGINPFQSGIDLWRAGLIPSYDGRIYRLHAGKEAKIVYELKK
jgi:hypothetical protein